MKGTLESSVAFTLPSRWMASMPAASDGAAENDARGCAPAGERVPRRGGVGVPERRGGAADARQLCLHLEAGERRGEGRAQPRLLDDDRGRVDRGVVVAVLDEQRDVEQVVVEHVRGDVGGRAVGDDVQLVGDLVGLERRRRAWPSSTSTVCVPSRQVGHLDAIAGDQRDGVRTAGSRAAGGAASKAERRLPAGSQADACDADRQAACGGDDRAQTTAGRRVS